MSHHPCPHCGSTHPYECYSIIKYRRRTNNNLHLIVSFCTCFMWLPVWAAVAAWNAWGPEATAYIEHH